MLYLHEFLDKEGTDMRAMIEIEEELARGKDLVISPHMNSLELASMIIRTGRGNIDVSHALINISNSNSLAKKIEDMRNNIGLGNYENAKEIASEIDKSLLDEMSATEFGLEETRILIFEGKFEEAIKYSERFLKSMPMSPVTKLTFLQIRGHALISLNKYELAVIELHKAITIGKLFPHVQSFYSSLACMVLALTKMNNAIYAQRYLKILKSKVDEFAGQECWPDRFMVYMRAKTFLHKLRGEFKELSATLKECREVSLWLNDVSTAEKCEKELNEIDEENKSDIVTKNFDNWCFLENEGLILHYNPKTFYHLQNSPLLIQIIKLLGQKEISYEDFFETIWKQKYDPERHGNHIRSYLSKIRKYLPLNALQVKSEMISLI